ncbi:hypothetical protein BD289DRAFT_450328 [Coniella lustricola]|uniref:C2H2-type domain-containing protein n=1 Tax=Coniella lustricola TaxID=2025994 RepID=A0A2T3AJ22_9PEZI|nr:hypothetical protein BD289DRAFT_450328 [Coniella lustricola]
MDHKTHAGSAFDFEDCTDDTINHINLLDPIDTTGGGFAFGPDTNTNQALSCPSSCPSTTGSFSSASSIYDPFTPTSRTSTPQQPIHHFDTSSSYDSNNESIMFDFTPPPSATSTYFPLDIKSTVAPNMLTQQCGMAVAPSTPSRCHNIFDGTGNGSGLSGLHHAGHHMGHSHHSHHQGHHHHAGLDFTTTTPTQDVDAAYAAAAASLSDALGSSPFMIPTPSPPFGGHNSNTPSCGDLTSMWGQHGDGSPITFSSPAMSLTTPSAHLGGAIGGCSVGGSGMGSYGGTVASTTATNMRRRVAMDGPQQTSAMLQQHLQQQHTTPTKMRNPISSSSSSKPRSAQARTAAQAQRAAHRVTKNLERIPPRKYKCDECNGKVYSRAEHLKRHKSEVHVDNPTKWVCDFCVPKPKVFGRCDNFRDHLKRHVQKNSGSRTKSQPGAAALLAKMQSEMKTKKRRVPKSESTPSPSTTAGSGAASSSPLSSPTAGMKLETMGSPLFTSALCLR